MTQFSRRTCLRLTVVLLTCFSLSSATASAQWIAHYVPISGPWGGFAQGLAVDSAGNIFVSGTAESSRQSQTCLFELDAQGNLRGEICFGTQASAAVAVVSDGNPVVAGSTYFPGAISIAPGQTPISAPQVQYSGDAPGLVKGEIQVNF